MTQQEIVAAYMKQGQYTIQQVHEATGILRPNIRRILGEGAIEGTFHRVARGVYVLKKTGLQIAWIECCNAKDGLRDLQAAGQKFDMVFLDPAYYSRNLIGGNRMKPDTWYEFIQPRDFYRCMEQIKNLVATDHTHVYLMLSNAPGTAKDMKNYITAAQLNGFRIAAEGVYQQTYRNGNPVINIQGQEAAGEKLLLLNKSGHLLHEVKMNFILPKPVLSEPYKTEKPPALCKQLIIQSTEPVGHVLDPFAGSGVMGIEALRLGRLVTLFDISINAVENFIMKKLFRFYGTNASN